MRSKKHSEIDNSDDNDVDDSITFDDGDPKNDDETESELSGSESKDQHLHYCCLVKTEGNTNLKKTNYRSPKKCDYKIIFLLRQKQPK